MESFPEEPLSLSAADGFGYFPADINQTLSGGRYTIVRKLGWGPRSSTWLVCEKDGGDLDTCYSAVQIFTAARSKEVESRLVPILQKMICYADPSTVPCLRSTFWESSIHGEHVCLVMKPHGLPFSDVLRDAKSRQAGLPVLIVQFTTSEIVNVLDLLHGKKVRVMHAGVKLENLVLGAETSAHALQTHISENPPSETQIVDGFPVVCSQPLANDPVDWTDPMRWVVGCWMLVLAGFGHAQGAPYTPESGFDYSSAPETLLENPTCGFATDIWMLGCLIFHLLTGSPLLSSTGTPSERLGEIRDVLQDRIPNSWLGDATVQALPKEDPSTQSLEQRLKQNLKEDEASAAYRFLRKCLVLVWMLGCLVFQLLTGCSLLTSTGTPSERLGKIRDILQDWIPSSWLGDATVQALPKEDPSTQSLEQQLKQNLTKDEVSAAYRFLRKCLVIDPAGRTSSRQLIRDEWVREGGQCSCGFK